MTHSELRQYAEIGAKHRLDQLHREIDAIHRLFPSLRKGRVASSRARPSNNNGRAMSAAQRKAVSDRMTAYWAKRRGETTTDAGKTNAGVLGHRTMSPEARQRIAEAQRKRWAEVKAKKSASEPQAASSAQPATSKPSAKKKK